MGQILCIVVEVLCVFLFTGDDGPGECFLANFSPIIGCGEEEEEGSARNRTLLRSSFPELAVEERESGRLLLEADFAADNKVDDPHRLLAVLDHDSTEELN
jgi:hypothetical protein